MKGLGSDLPPNSAEYSLEPVGAVGAVGGVGAVGAVGAVGGHLSCLGTNGRSAVARASWSHRPASLTRFTCTGDSQSGGEGDKMALN